MSSFRDIFHSRAEKDGMFFREIKNIIGFRPGDLSIYEMVLSPVKNLYKKGSSNLMLILKNWKEKLPVIKV